MKSKNLFLSSPSVSYENEEYDDKVGFWILFVSSVGARVYLYEEKGAHFQNFKNLHSKCMFVIKSRHRGQVVKGRRIDGERD